MPPPRVRDCVSNNKLCARASNIVTLHCTLVRKLVLEGQTFELMDANESWHLYFVACVCGSLALL